MLGMDSHERKSEDKLAKATKDGCVLFPLLLHGTLRSKYHVKCYKNKTSISKTL